MMEWQPIETAPKDGTAILAYTNSEVLSLYWSDSIWAAVNNPVQKQGGGWVQEVNRSDTYVYCPTHWMPLPPPPALTPDDGEVKP